MSQLLGAIPICVLLLFPSLFTDILRLVLNLLIYGSPLGAYPLGPILMLHPLLVIGGSTTYFGLFRISFLYLCGSGIKF